MTKLRALRYASIAILFISTIAAAENVKKGVLLVRRGDPTKDANYDKDDRDANDKLMGVSVQCNPDIKIPADNKKVAKLTKGLDGFNNYGTANSTCIINAGGNVDWDKSGNPNHCTINSITIGALKSCWTLH